MKLMQPRNGKWTCIYIAPISSAQNILQYLQHSPIHAHIHTLMAEAAMQGADCSSGAIWGSVSCSRLDLKTQDSLNFILVHFSVS